LRRNSRAHAVDRDAKEGNFTPLSLIFDWFSEEFLYAVRRQHHLLSDFSRHISTAIAVGRRFPNGSRPEPGVRGARRARGVKGEEPLLLPAGRFY
jgi:hypothetical protein